MDGRFHYYTKVNGSSFTTENSEYYFYTDCNHNELTPKSIGIKNNQVEKSMAKNKINLFGHHTL